MLSAMLHSVSVLYRCRGLILLETYTSNRSEDFKVPPFLSVQQEVTGDTDYSMYSLSMKLDRQLPVPSALSKDQRETSSVDKSSKSELSASEVDDDTFVMPSGSDSVLGQLEMTGKQTIASEMNPKDFDDLLLMSASAANLLHDSTLDEPQGILPSEKMTVAVDGFPSGLKNGYHCDIARDKMASLALDKLDISSGSAPTKSSMSETGCFVAGKVDERCRLSQLSSTAPVK